jgi:hypothetical protein
MSVGTSPSQLRARTEAALSDRIQVDSSDGKLRVLVPVRREGYRILLDSVWLTILVAFEVAMVLLLLGKAPPEMAPGVLTRSAIALCLGFATVGGLILVWRILWMIWGQEEFAMEKGTFSARKGIGPVTFSTRRFTQEKVRNPRAARLRYHLFYPGWGRPFVNHEEHQLSFDVDRWTYHAARGLTRAEADHLASLLNEALDRERTLRQAS